MKYKLLWVLYTLLGFGPACSQPDPVSDWAPDQFSARYHELKFEYCRHPLTGRLVPSKWINCQVLFGTVTNFTGGRIVLLDSPLGPVAVFRDTKYTGRNGDEVAWMVRNYGSYTRENRSGEPEVLRMFDEITMTPELFLQYVRAGYPFKGRPATVPAPDGRSALVAQPRDTGKTALHSEVRIDKKMQKKDRRLNRLPTQFTGDKVRLERMPSQFEGPNNDD